MNNEWKKKAKVATIQEKQTTYEQWTAQELTTMVSWFKRPGDSKIPSTRAKLVDTWRHVIGWSMNEIGRNRIIMISVVVIDY